MKWNISENEICQTWYNSKIVRAGLSVFDFLPMKVCVSAISKLNIQSILTGSALPLTPYGDESIGCILCSFDSGHFRQVLTAFGIIVLESAFQRFYQMDNCWMLGFDFVLLYTECISQTDAAIQSRQS